MKGTPFYTGEYSARQGPVEDRVNLWPLLYYRDPALSVLWPFVELTDEHFAVRPVFSMYGLDEEHKVYNVLWPLAQFNTGDKEHRVFPVFWGENYASVFPLYWHRSRDGEHPRVMDTLLPLWWYGRDRKGSNLHVAMPVFQLRRKQDAPGWRVWPLAGSYREGENAYAFAFWPLGHKWSRWRSQGNAFLPLYWYEREEGQRTFLSLPYSFGRGGESDWDTVLPLFHRSSDESTYRVVTPLYSRGGTHDGSEAWAMSLPFYYTYGTEGERLVATLLGGWWKDRKHMYWLALPALSWGRTGEKDGSAWLLGPLAHVRWGEDGNTQHVFPFYYSSRDERGSTFLSLPWSSSRNKDGDAWQLALPWFYRRQGADGSSALVTPLYSAGKDPANDSRWHSLVPLYFSRQEGDERLCVTPLGGVSRDEDGRRWLIYPLLSGGRRGEDGGHVWVLAPLAHADWDREGVSHHLLPFYYWNGRTDKLLSPLAATWETDDGTRRTLMPPLLSLYSTGERRSDLWALAGLAHLSWGEEAGPQHVVPFFYRNPGTGTFISPLVAGWREGDITYRALPLLLSAYSFDAQSLDVTVLLGAFHNHWEENADRREGHLFPFYYYKGKRILYTPLAGWKKDDADGFVYPFTPLVGVRRGDYAGGWLFPLLAHKRHRVSGDMTGRVLWSTYNRRGRRFESRTLPLYRYRNDGPIADAQSDDAEPGRYGKVFHSLPACWYRDQVTVWTPKKDKASGGPRRVQLKESGFFPLWSYSRRTIPEQGREKARARVLLLLYDYLKRAGPDTDEPEKRDEYVRARVLWRLWHYERVNDEVSVDVFPAITYDRRDDSFRKVSLLWRLFRYERDTGGVDLDLLFIPFRRARED